MSERSKYLDVVLKLNRLTQDGKLKWTHHPANSTGQAAARAYLEEYYSTEHGDKSFALLKPSYATLKAVQQPEAATFPVYAATFTLMQRMFHAMLQVLGDRGEALFTFPSMSAIDDLYDTVALNNEEVEAFFDDFLSEEG